MVSYLITLSMVSHVNAVCKSAYFHLHKISKIRKFLTPETTKTIIHAFVTSKIDYCNSLLFGLPNVLLQRLQRVLNCAARVVYQSNKYDHITPLLMELHWLPVQQRINFKILLITYRALNGQAPSYISDLLSVTTVQQDRYVRLHKICFAILVIILKIMGVGPLQWLPHVYGTRYLWP